MWSADIRANVWSEEDFYGFSYGFRPGRSQHYALCALQTFLQKGKVNWVLDLDLKACFDGISHQALQETIQHRVTDRSIIRLIGKWLKVGVVEADGRREKGQKGTPQGAVISLLLANIVLHEAMDQIIHQWRQHEARGEVYVVRYADNCVMGFEYEEDEHALKSVLVASLAGYGLSMNEAKTRLIRFGRSWPSKGEKSETFDFLGLTHIAGKDRQGRYLVIRKTMRQRIRRSLKSKRPKVHHLVDEVFVLAKPCITHSEGWLTLKPGYLAGRVGCGNAARPVL